MAESTSPTGVVEELKSAVAASIAGNVELVARLNAVIKEAAAAGPAAAPTDGGEVLSRLIKLGLGSYAELNKHVLALLNGLVGVAERTLLPASAAAAAGASKAAGTGRVDLRLDGRIGERVASPFLVENQYDEAVDVSFRADPLCAPGHPDVPPSVVGFEPSRLSILPRGSAVATAMIDVTEGFAAGATYTTTLRLVGFESREIGLALTVAPAAEVPGARGGTKAAAATPVRRRRPPKVRSAGPAG